MNKRAGALLASLLLVGLTLFGLAGAAAQQYPPPTPTATNTPRPTPPHTPGATTRPTPRATPRATATPDASACLVVRGEDDGQFETGTADFRSLLEIEGAEGCAEAFGDISVTVRSDPVRFPTFQAFEDGSFHRIFCMPAAITPGNHTVEVAIEGRGVRNRDLRVEGDNRGDDCGPGDGTVVRGSSQTNNGSGGRSSGTLPNNGAEILLLLMWAVVLIGGGTALAMMAWRHRDRFALASIRRGSAPLALPAPEIPLIDTSRFTPYRSRTTKTHRSTTSDAKGRSSQDESHRWPYS